MAVQGLDFAAFAVLIYMLKFTFILTQWNVLALLSYLPKGNLEYYMLFDICEIEIPLLYFIVHFKTSMFFYLFLLYFNLQLFIVGFLPFYQNKHSK